MASLAMENGGAYLDASIVVQQVLSKLDSVVEHVSLLPLSLDMRMTDQSTAAQ